MLKRIAAAVVVALVVFLGYVASRDGKFHYERSAVYQAPPEKIYAYLSDFKKGQEWSPFAQKDPNMKLTFSGPEGQPGWTMGFEGNSDVGAGKLEMLKLVPNERVEIKLTMLKPFYGENLIEYILTPEAGGTKFTWAMSGDGGFMGKLMSTLIDCEKMIGGEFEKGLANLKPLVETPSQSEPPKN